MNSKLFNKKYWLDWLAPNKCPVCRKAIMWDELICKDCLEKLPFLDDKHITKCESNVEFICSLFEYSGSAKNGIMNLKLREGVNLAEYSVNLLCNYLRNQKIPDEIELITSVPMRGIIKRNRGYNQAEIIAKYVSRELNKPVNNKLLKCRRSKLKQHELNAIDRFKNAENSYVQKNKHFDIKNKNILICDDVITTGATIGACAKVLKSMGARKVFAVTICSTELYNSKSG